VGSGKTLWVGFAGPQPQELDCGEWLTLLPTVAHYIIFKPRTPDSPCRVRAFGSAIPRLFIAPVILKRHGKVPLLPEHRGPRSDAGFAPTRKLMRLE